MYSYGFTLSDQATQLDYSRGLELPELVSLHRHAVTFSLASQTTSNGLFLANSKMVWVRELAAVFKDYSVQVYMEQFLTQWDFSIKLWHIHGKIWMPSLFKAERGAELVPVSNSEENSL